MFEETIQNLIALLETESNTAIEWFQNDKIIEWFQNNKKMFNPGKVQAIIIDKNMKCYTRETLKIGDKLIKAPSSAKLLGVQIDNQLNLTSIFLTFVDLQQISSML